MNLTIRKYLLPHAHPVKFMAEVLGLVWGSYFLWQHQWVVALIGSTVLFVASTAVLWGKDMEHLASSTLGRFSLAYATPVGFILYNLSALPLIYGLWVHNAVFIVIATVLFLLPHLLAKR